MTGASAQNSTQDPAWGLRLRQSCVASSSIHPFLLPLALGSFSELELMTF